MIQLSKEFHFHAAHFLKDHPGKCKNIHGHTYKLVVTLKGNILNEIGMLLDFGFIKKIVKERIIKRVDHKLLNDVLNYIPTAENMAKNFFYDLNDVFSEFLYSVTIWETETSYATWMEE